MKKREHTTKYRADYQSPAYLVDEIYLEFDLQPVETRVKAISYFKRNERFSQEKQDLILYGEHLELIKITYNDTLLTEEQYRVDDVSLTIKNPDDTFTLEIETLIHPDKNKALSGLYRSSNNYCTQCEAEGFRRITYFPDRPDVLARYTTKIIADKDSCPVMLSNGELVEKGEVGNGKHYVIWKDPFPKPSYLFALVAGNLACVQDVFTTKSNREVQLQLYVQHENKEKCEHAMRSLKKAMRWDEEVYNLEYDLNVYMIVAVDDFNMGAMENKGLNIFNSKYVLASPETATDSDYLGIEGVIAHEYFHNWTGNRVTCRDWFQLSLKEGLTVFRDQQFSGDMNSQPVKRIEEVQVLRNSQFREDAGPMAHPVRPDSYVEINNFYTVTVYNKGAEVIRMLHTILGKEYFHKGMDLYIARHDGQAVTCEDFVKAMEDASGRDLSQFRLWYSQAGTPEVAILSSWDDEQKKLSITCTQTIPETPDKIRKQAMHIPMRLGLLDMKRDENGFENLIEEREELLHLTEKKQVFTFTDFTGRPLLSPFRNFSSPVKVHTQETRQDIAALMAYDTDLFNRWDAAQKLFSGVVMDVIHAMKHDQKPVVDPLLLRAIRQVIEKVKDSAFVALAIKMPMEGYIAQQMKAIDPYMLGRAYGFTKAEIGYRLRDIFLDVYRKYAVLKRYTIDHVAIGQRSLKNTCLDYLMASTTVDADEKLIEICENQYLKSTNMTDTIAALLGFSHLDDSRRESLLQHFYSTWKDDKLVIDKWFSIQAMSRRSAVLEDVRKLTDHPAFSIDNPNRVRALIGAFSAGNHFRFHHPDGKGYQLLAEYVCKLDKSNPQIAARLVTPLISYANYEKSFAKLMKKQLQEIAERKELSSDVYEIITKSLF